MPKRPEGISPDQLVSGKTLEKLIQKHHIQRTDDERLNAYQDAIEDVHDRAARDGNWKAQLAAVKLAVETIIGVKRKRIEDNPNDGGEQPEPDVTGKSLDELKRLAGGDKP